VCAGLLACRYCIFWVESGARTDSLVALEIATGCAIIAAATGCIGTYLLKSGLKIVVIPMVGTQTSSDSGESNTEVPTRQLDAKAANPPNASTASKSP
jgi:hypothetical protein